MVIKRVRKSIRLPSPVRALRRGVVTFGNRLRRRYTDLDYVMLNLPDAMPPLPESRSWIRQRLQGPPPLSLLDLDRIFERIADDPRPKGVILMMRGLMMSLADLETLRQSIFRLRGRGKRVVCYAQMYGLGQYFVASACDEILIQPGGELMTVGLREEAMFLKDTLDTIGVQLDVVAISPYKGAYDRLSRSTMSPEGREQLEWILDSRYEILLNGFAQGRGWTHEQARAFVDTSPHLDTAALAAGYVDGVLNEEALAAHLGVKHLVTWKSASKMLFVKLKKESDKYVALLRVAGLMISGESGEPPVNIPIPIPFVGGERAGDRTVVRHVRGLMKNENAAAVILFIDSGGGLATAAEAMTSALEELAKTRPVVVFMNSVAASGGYYIATAGRWIVAQPGTITGSIGVVTAKPVTSGLMERAHVNTVEFTRGANATLYSEAEPFTEEQRARVRGSITHIYGQFVRRVARSRKLSEEAVDALGGGRVWTGVQAKANGLVDEIGDLQAALKKARELANLPADTPLYRVEGKGKPLPPQVAEAANPAAALTYLLDNARSIANGSAQVIMPVWWHSKDKL
jgi:protease IV